MRSGTMVAIVVIVVMIAVAILTWKFGRQLLAGAKGHEGQLLSLMIDQTDPMLKDLDAETLEQSFGVHERSEIFNSAWFRIRSITELMNTKVYEARLKTGNKLYDSHLDRRNAIRGFYTNIRNAIERVSAISERKGSLIWPLVVDELEVMAKYPDMKRKLIIWSDLRENSAFFNLYDMKMLQSVLNDPSILEEKLRELPLLDVSGIDIQLNYIAPGPEEAQIYDVVSQVYKEVLLERGATVTINLQIK